MVNLGSFDNNSLKCLVKMNSLTPKTPNLQKKNCWTKTGNLDQSALGYLVQKNNTEIFRIEFVAIGLFVFATIKLLGSER